MPYRYIRRPEEIYRESFRLIAEAVDLTGYDGPTAKLVERLVHTGGRPDIVPRLRIHSDAVKAGIKALRQGAPVFCDARMVAEGVIQRLLPAANPLVCTLDRVAYEARATDTRSARAVEIWAGGMRAGEIRAGEIQAEEIQTGKISTGSAGKTLAGSVAAIGNAPTALFRLLELLHKGTPPPALIIGMPVGFVGAADSKQALLDDFPAIPHIVLTGREGGSAYAAAAVNALAALAQA